MDLSPLKIDREARRRRRRSSGRFVPLAVLLLLVGAGYVFRRPLLGWIDRFRLVEVRVVRVERSRPGSAGALRGAAANGHIVASRRAALSADTPGRIVAMNVEEGSVVREGDVVARLYSEEQEAAFRRAEAELEVARAQVGRSEAEVRVAREAHERMERAAEAAAADVEEARASLELARIQLERARKLVEEEVESARLLDEARAAHDEASARLNAAGKRSEASRAEATAGAAAVQSAEAQLEVDRRSVSAAEASRDLARATLEKTEVRAPFDGVVVLKDAEVGEVVSPNSQAGSNARGAVVTMVDFASLEVQADVPETSVAAVRVGAPAVVYLDAYPDKPYGARVDRIWPTADRQKATIEVRAVFTQPDELLRPEMGVRIVFPAEQADEAATGAANGEPEAPAVLVPREAIVRADGREGVFVVERDVVRFLAITAREGSAGRVAVETGLSGGERVVLDPPPALRDGERVRPRED